MSAYNVVVDFEIVASSEEIAHLFEGNAIHVENIGPNQYQVGIGIEAPPEENQEAYRRAVNLVHATLEAAGLGSTGWTDAEVYDE